MDCKERLRDCFDEMVVYKDLKKTNFFSALSETTGSSRCCCPRQRGCKAAKRTCQCLAGRATERTDGRTPLPGRSTPRASLRR